MSILRTVSLGITALFLGIVMLVGLLLFMRSQQVAEYKPSFEALDVSPEAWQSKGETFVFNESNLFYIDEGEGPAILFLHGYPSSSWDYHKVWAELSSDHRLITLDFKGYGYSDKPQDAAYSISDNADSVAALLAHVEAPDVQIVAHDIGILVAQELLARQERGDQTVSIRSLVLMNGSFFNAERVPSRTQDLLAGQAGWIINAAVTEETLVENLVNITGNPNASTQLEFEATWYLLNYPSNHRALHRLSYPAKDRERNEVAWTDGLCQTDVPLHLLIGRQDPSSGERMSASLADHCQGNDHFKLTLLDNVGHFPQLESPERVARILKEWEDKAYALQ